MGLETILETLGAPGPGQPSTPRTTGGATPTPSPPTGRKPFFEPPHFFTAPCTPHEPKSASIVCF